MNSQERVHRRALAGIISTGRESLPPRTKHQSKDQAIVIKRLPRLLKRGFDVVFALTVLTWLLPFLIIIGCALLVESGRPIVFKQRRGGREGTQFTIYKFRTMRVLENGPEVVQAKQNDPRVTKLGSFLRKTSVDELPQLWNVLKGDMSIVGPRPHALIHDTYYEQLLPFYRERQVAKPGITGWAQVQGLRGETRTVEEMAARVEADLWYIENWSLWLDFCIVMKTAKELLFVKNQQ